MEIPQARPADVHAGLAGSGGDHSRTDRLRQIFEEERIDAERAPQFVLITDHRLKLIDPDNLNIKSLLDCLRYAKKIPDDSADDIRVLVRQRKVARVEETGTEIEVI